MPVEGAGRRRRTDNRHVPGDQGNAGDVRGNGNANRVGDANNANNVNTDGIDGTPGNTPGSAVRNRAITGDFAALAKKGDFSGYVMTKSGQELFVSLRVSKENPGNEKPLVYLDGLAARRNRSDMMADKFRDEGGRTVISILLPGQGETLVRDLQKNNGRSLNRDISDTGQAQAVIEALDALGVEKPVDIFGLSYGGAIASACERDHAERFDSVLLVAPHVRSQARDEMGELSWQMVANNPWNPMGNAMYRSAAKSTLGKAFGVPELFKDHPQAFPEALFRLSMGIDRNELHRTVQDSDNIHILVAKEDGASPLKWNEKAKDAAKSGSLTIAPDSFTGQHDLVSASPELVVAWVTATLNPERADKVNATLQASMKKRVLLQTAQQMVALAAKTVMDGVNANDPAKAFKGAFEGANLAAAAAKAALDAVESNGAPAVEVADTAAKIAAEAATLVRNVAAAIGTPEAKDIAKQADTAAMEAAAHAKAAREALDP